MSKKIKNYMKDKFLLYQIKNFQLIKIKEANLNHFLKQFNFKKNGIMLVISLMLNY